MKTSPTTNTKTPDIIDLREGVTDNKAGVTNLLPAHAYFDNDLLLDAINALNRKFALEAVGIYELNAAERFAMAVLVKQYEQTTGRRIT